MNLAWRFYDTRQVAKFKMKMAEIYSATAVAQYQMMLCSWLARLRFSYKSRSRPVAYLDFNLTMVTWTKYAEIRAPAQPYFRCSRVSYFLAWFVFCLKWKHAHLCCTKIVKVLNEAKRYVSSPVAMCILIALYWKCTP